MLLGDANRLQLNSRSAASDAPARLTEKVAKFGSASRRFAQTASLVFEFVCELHGVLPAGTRARPPAEQKRQ
jgi:hypothetical protein